MNHDQKLGTLAAEISTLELETFEIADYADTDEVFMVSGPSACSCSSTCSTTSCTA
jgi:thiazolylpeptide-type bacteriocin precursor